MLDFRKKDLFKKEQVKMNNFLNKKLLTNSQSEAEEYDAQMNSDGLGVLEAGDFVDGDAFDLGNDDNSFGGLGGFGDDVDDGGFGSFGDAGDRSGVRDATDWKYEGNPGKTFAFAPLHLFRYIFQDLTKDPPKGKEWLSILKALNTINVFCFFTALFAMALGMNTIFSPLFQLLAGAFMFIVTTVIICVVYKEHTRTSKFVLSILKGENNFDGKEEDAEGRLLDEEDDLSLGGDMEDSGFAFSSLEDEEDENGFGIGPEEEYDDPDDEEDEYTASSGLKESPIGVESDEEFMEGLLEVFAKNDKYKSKIIQDRGKLVHSFSEYLIQNDRTFGKWKRPKENGTVYNNIAYALFKGLCQIETQFASYQTEDRMHIIDIKESPLLYRIELSLPNYFKEKKIQAQMKVLEDILRESEDDLEVSVLLTTFQGNFVIKLLRLDNKNMVTLGDILRFEDEDKGYVGLKAFEDADYGLPVLLGLQNNENPYVVDWEANTSGTIIGGSGSGKSWATFEMMMNFVISNDYRNVNFIVLDAKNAPFWNAFARFPHVLGYHTDPLKYIDILREVEEERKKRQEMLNELGAEDLKGYRKSLRKKKEYEKLKEVPLLFLVVDEITATMAELKEQDEDLFKTASSLLGQIASKGRSAGVRILSIGQRSTYDSVPKTLLANSSFKFGMKMEVQNDFITLFGDDVKKYKTPNTLGMGLSKTEGNTTMQMIKTLTIGGTSNEQMLMLIRTLAFEWVRRSYGIDNIKDMPANYPFQKAYNRSQFYEKNIREMTEGRILGQGKVNEGYEVLFDEAKKEEGYKLKAAQKRIERNERKKQEKENLDWVENIVPSFDANTKQEEDEELPAVEDTQFEKEFDTDFGRKEIEQEIPTFPNETENGTLTEKDEEDITFSNGKDEYQETEDTDIFASMGNFIDVDEEDEEENHLTEKNPLDINSENENDDEDFIVQDIESFLLEDMENADDLEAEDVVSEEVIFPLNENNSTDSEEIKKQEIGFLEEDDKSSEDVSLDALIKKVREDKENQEALGGENGGEIDREISGEVPGEPVDFSLKKEKTEEKTPKTPENRGAHQPVHQENHYMVHKEEKASEPVNLDDLLGTVAAELDLEEAENDRLNQLEKPVYSESKEFLTETVSEVTTITASESASKEETEIVEPTKVPKEEKQEINKTQKVSGEIFNQDEERPVQSVTGGSAETNKIKDVKSHPKGQKTKKEEGLVFDFVSPVKVTKKEPAVSIKAYIMENGVSKGLHVYMSKEELNSVYTDRKIKEALDKMTMIESKGYYIVRV